MLVTALAKQSKLKIESLKGNENENNDMWLIQ